MPYHTSRFKRALGNALTCWYIRSCKYNAYKSGWLFAVYSNVHIFPGVPMASIYWVLSVRLMVYRARFPTASLQLALAPPLLVTQFRGNIRREVVVTVIRYVTAEAQESINTCIVYMTVAADSTIKTKQQQQQHISLSWLVTENDVQRCIYGQMTSMPCKDISYIWSSRVLLRQLIIFTVLSAYSIRLVCDFTLHYLANISAPKYKVCQIPFSLRTGGSE